MQNTVSERRREKIIIDCHSSFILSFFRFLSWTSLNEIRTFTKEFRIFQNKRDLSNQQRTNIAQCKASNGNRHIETLKRYFCSDDVKQSHNEIDNEWTHRSFHSSHTHIQIAKKTE